MRFKKGSKVEVMNKEVPASWRVAEIISENGHAYNVRYDGCKGVEKVPRRFIRPCPPANDSQRLATGDIVEVFDGNSWTIATVLKVLRGGRFLVRPHGFTHEMSVYKKNIRARQSWRDDQWIPVGKISGSYEDVKFGKAVEPNCSVKMGIQVLLAGSKICQEEDDCLPVYNDARLQESYVVSKKLKRSSPFCSSLLEGSGKAKKFKAAEKDCSQRHVSGHSFNQVDAFAYPGDNLGNKYVQDSFNNSLNGYCELEKRKTNGVGCTLARISEPNDSDTDLCSVGSCSVPSDGHKLSSPYDADILSSDGESFNTSRDEEGKCSPPEQEVAVSIHRLELDAYRSTLEALYASGPLSWEKEALLTNLRINLHISNDEHLTELRHLISSGAEPQLEACISCFQGSKQDSGSAAFLLEKAVGHIQHPFATDKTASPDLSSLAGDDMLIKVCMWFYHVPNTRKMLLMKTASLSSFCNADKNLETETCCCIPRGSQETWLPFIQQDGWMDVNRKGDAEYFCVYIFPSFNMKYLAFCCTE